MDWNLGPGGIEVARFIEEGKLAHYQDPRARHRKIENEAIRRATQFAEHLDSPLYVVHMSTSEGGRLISRARERGAPVWGETCTHYLVLDDGYLSGEYYLIAVYMSCPQTTQLTLIRLSYRGKKDLTLCLPDCTGLKLGCRYYILKAFKGSNLFASARCDCQHQCSEVV